MVSIWKWIKSNPNRFMFLIPIILVAVISISHVVTWYDMANPIMWAVYLSVAIEIAAMTALVAASNRITSGIWLMFGLVTFIQIIGNVFYSFKEIDETGELFKSWVELTSPVWEVLGTEITDIVSLKRWLAFLTGGLLPVISLTSLHFFISFDKENETDTEKKNSDQYFESRNKEIVNVVMSKPEGTEFDTPYPFTEEMKESIKKAEEANVEETIGSDDDYDSEGNLNYTPPEPKPPVEEESKAKSVKATTPTTSGEEEDLIWVSEDEITQKEKEIEEDIKQQEIEKKKLNNDQSKRKK